MATDYFGVSPDSSESNYVALLGGSVHHVTSDDAYWTQEINAPSLISQLDHAGMSWKAYLQALPYPGYQGICYPAKCNGAPDSDPLYVSKHDGIQNYTTSLSPADWSRQVPIGQLGADLRTGDVPRFSYVVPDECHDMHGDPPYCLDSGNIKDPQNQHLVAVGDAYLGRLVSEITHAPFWATGNNAIAITYDNGDNSAGCCDAKPGGGRIATVVVTSHGPRGIRDGQPANHYSLLSTIQHAFGLGCLAHTCDTRHVQPLGQMFAVTGSAAVATTVLPERPTPTPTPAPAEPRSRTRSTASAGGWTVQRAGRLGGNDNSLGVIAGSSPRDIWAFGDFLPDAKGSNQDATLSFAEHYNGAKWTAAEPPDAGVNFDSFYGGTASHGWAWAVGERLNGRYQDRALIDVWNGHRWSIADTPQPGSRRDMLFAASALSPSDVWVVGDQEGANGRFETLAEHWDGSTWSVVPLPAATSASELLDAIAVAHGQVWVAGEADSPATGGRPLIEEFRHGAWRVASLPAAAGSDWTDLYGLAVTRTGTVWAVGTYLDKPRGDNNNALILRGHGTSWTVDRGPDPGSGGNILGGVAVIGGQVWAAGIYDNGGSELPLIERR